MKEYNHYLFDLYGTLVDIHTNEEAEMLWQRMNVLLAMHGVHTTSKKLQELYLSEVTRQEEIARKQRGPFAEIDIAAVFETFFTAHSVPIEPQIIEQLTRAFRVMSIEKLKLFPGVPALLQRLHQQGKGAFLVSNAQALFTLPELSALNLTQYFDGIVISSEEGIKKPDPAIYHLTLERYNLEATKTVMVGNDDGADCWGAHHAGLDSMYIFTEQSPKRSNPLPPNCRQLSNISEVF